MALSHSIKAISYLICLALLSLLLSNHVFADSANYDSAEQAADLPEPHQLVQDITDSLLLVINDEQLDPVANPDEFYQRANTILAPVVAFDFIARGVMGSYANQVTPEYQLKFTEAFKKGLVNTYSKGVTTFSDSVDITTVPPEADITGQRKVAVVQEIISRDTTTYVSYTMAQNREQQWKLINVVLNGVNLGQTFRGQFAQEVEKHQGDVVKVIDNWEKRE